ncbi:Tn3 family transposase [Streptomyces sp. R28]|uniref:Tn3 family transposase n=1 Tax=Streptomyces sp. R28 TaxID=3238628 RepID=A0AB39PP43_9ACTN
MPARLPERLSPSKSRSGTVTCRCVCKCSTCANSTLSLFAPDTLCNTRYMDAAVDQLRADGFDVRDEDVARLSPFVRQHINMLGRYSFKLPELPGGMRPLRDKDAADDE